MAAITKHGSHSQALIFNRSYWRLNLNTCYNKFFPGVSFSRSQSPKKLSLLRATMSPTNDNSTNRPFTPYPPTLWGDHFLSASVNQMEMDDLGREIEALKLRVNAMLLPSNGADLKQIILMIHKLISLGVSYHFEDEIVKFLNDAFKNTKDMNMIIDCNEDDLYTVSVMFRVFRLYGHNMSSDIFNRFKGDDGKFKKCLIKDVRGMLSFYEASHFGTTTEVILDEAMSFTQKHLELFLVGVKATHHPHISKLIHNALYLPQNYNLEILVIREYIRFYEKETDHDERVLKLANLNFKFMQLHYIQDLKTLTAWWRDLDLVSKIPNYFRDRVAESYFWTTGICYQPQYSAARIILAKTIIILDVMDTTFDVYGSLAEVESLAQSIERWEYDAVDVLPDYLKIVFKTTLDMFKEFEEEVRSEGRSYSVHYACEEFKRVIKAYLQEAKWASSGHVPSYEEYMEVAMSSVAGGLMLGSTFIALGEIAREDTYAWLTSTAKGPKLSQAVFAKCRLRDDISTFKDEMNRGDIANGINCYTKQYGVTEEEASLEFEKMINHKCKLINEEFLKTANFLPLQILRPILNFGRLADVTYKYGDGFTYAGEKTKDYITSLYIDLITL
ncbi:unnamed protein product [Arabidopsis halleri]